MHVQESIVLDTAQPAFDRSVFGWLNALRDELASHGVTVGVSHQFNDDDTVVAYRQAVTVDGANYVLECKLQDEHALYLRASFFRADIKDRVLDNKDMLLSYRVNIGASANDTHISLSRHLGAARKRIPLVAGYFNEAHRATLVH